MNIKLYSSEAAASFLGISRQGLAAAVKSGYIRPVEVFELNGGKVNILSSHKLFKESSLIEYNKSEKRRHRK